MTAHSRYVPLARAPQYPGSPSCVYPCAIEWYVRWGSRQYARLGRLDITPDNFDKDKGIYFAIAFQTTLVCLIPLVNLIVFRTVLKQVNIWNQFQGGNK